MLPNQHLYGVAWGVAGLVWVLCGALALDRRLGGQARLRVLGLLLATVLAAVGGARLHFLLLAPGLVADAPWRALLVWSPEDGAGLRLTGGLLAALAVLLIGGPAATRRRLTRAELLDVVVPLAGVAIAVGRLGCFADGCCFGVPCSRAWCVRFPTGTPVYWNHVAQGLIGPDATRGAAVHAVQLYLGAAGLLAYAAAAGVRRRGPAAGTAALVFVLVMSLLRGATETLRETSFGVGVTYQGAVDATCAAVALALLLWRRQGLRGAVGAGSGAS